MQNLRALRQRIRSVQNTQKITKAMQMVAGAKLRRSQEELSVFRPYADRLEEMAQKFLAAYPHLQHPILKNDLTPFNPKGVSPLDPPKGSDPCAPAGLLILSSDTGLCGSYNERILAVADRSLGEMPSARVVTIGRKGTRRLARQGTARFREILDWGGKFDLDRVGSFVDWMQQLFVAGEVSSWTVVYTQFLSALSWKPASAKLFPMERPAAQEFPEKLIVEPAPEQLADLLLRRAVRARFSRILLEAFTAEHSARMVAMKNATENASEMIDSLTLIRNKARQAAITKELIEVVSGAQAALS